MSTTREKDCAYARDNTIIARDCIWIFADGCAHRDQQTIAFLRELGRRFPADAELMELIADRFGRREHVK